MYVYYDYRLRWYSFVCVNMNDSCPTGLLVQQRKNRGEKWQEKTGLFESSRTMVNNCSLNSPTMVPTTFIFFLFFLGVYSPDYDNCSKVQACMPNKTIN